MLGLALEMKEGPFFLQITTFAGQETGLTSVCSGGKGAWIGAGTGGAGCSTLRAEEKAIRGKRRLSGSLSRIIFDQHGDGKTRGAPWGDVQYSKRQSTARCAG